MKVSVLQIMLRMFCCALVLFPQYALAGAVSIPGMSSGTAAPRMFMAGPATAPVTINIPGFYGPVTPPSNTQLPVVLQNGQNGVQNPVQGATVSDPSQNQLTIQQTQQQAIINWASFNIGANASVTFNQQGNADWVALNRIWDANPSQIYGSLTADGRIYLINQNGILFGPGSKVNVNSLTASALNIKDNDFLANTLHFVAEDYQNPDPAAQNPNYLAAVSNFGEINAADGGNIFLMAPRVENFGTINAPTGQIGLVAGTDVQLLPPDESDTSRSGGYYVKINDDFLNAPRSTDADFGRAVNREGGQLNADGGVVGMHGNNVDQWGIIRSVTAFHDKNGQVELRAANKITTGANSAIDLHVDDSVDPETGLPPTISDTFDIQPVVFIGGLSKSSSNDMRGGTNAAKEVVLEGSIVAPAGNVTVRATDRVYMEAGSSIDVSGVVADLPIAVLEDAKLTSVELRDYYDQKNGVLQGEKITTPLTSGSSIGDMSQAMLTRDKTAYERLVGGDVRKVLYHNDATGQDTWQYVAQTGNIDMNVTNGDIIVKQGALLNFSGGAINYESGLVDSTKLLSGTQVYDISNAPANIQYDRIVGNYEKTYDRFGVRETYSGLYYGGASSLKTYVQGYTQGGDAGTLSLTAHTVVLDGTLNGGVTPGEYQNAWTTRSAYGTDADYYEALMLSKAQGLETPRAGTLNIGNSGSTTVNNPTSISVLSTTDPQTELNADSPLLTGQPTQISARTVNAANLGGLNLFADLTIDTAVDADLVLQPGGKFSAQARRIDQEGKITVHGGEIDLSIAQNNTSQLNLNGTSNGDSYLPLDERIIVGKNSVLDASGERIDNSQAGVTGNDAAISGRTGGGSILIMDETDQGAGVFIQKGAVLDVSGGYIISQKGKITGGNAGSLSIQGANIELDGDLRGYALADGNLLGGNITLSATNITVAPSSSIPQWYDWSANGFDPAGSDPDTSSVSAGMQGKLYLADDRFDDTGFTRITLNSRNDLIIGQNATITPSLVRLNNPAVVQTGANSPVTGQEVPGSPDLIRLDAAMSYMAGQSAFTANAAKPFAGSPSSGSPNYFTGNLKVIENSPANLLVSSGAVIRTTPGGSLSLSGPSVLVDGTLDSPAGNIAVTATNGDLLVENNAKITATGYNRPDPSSTPKGFSSNYQPIDGGNVALAAKGALKIDFTSVVDVSGSNVVENTILSDGKISSYSAASNPGSVSLSYGSDLDWQGRVVANHAQLDGLSGGSLAITRTDTSAGMTVSSMEIGYIQSVGFDDLTFKSKNSLIFSDDINNVVIGRKLTLDAPEITGAENNVTISAPWIVLTNTSNMSPLSPANSAAPGAGSLTLSGGWTDAAGVHSGFIDVIGDIHIDGFKDVTLKTDQDIRLSQVLYDNNFTAGNGSKPGTVNNGILATTGNLVLDADTIYPGNYYSYDTNHGSNLYPDLYSDYTIQANGKVTLQHTVRNGDTTAEGPVYSAGGSLTVEGLAGIDVENGVTLSAPLGAITLSAPGKRIYLAEGSILTTAGSGDVMYGVIDPNNLWVTRDKTNPSNLGTTSLFTQDSLSEKGISLDAGNNGEVIARDGSLIDASGGGSVFAYKFLPGVEGSVDPLVKPGRYVVFSAGSNPMPGPAVYLQGGGGLGAGMYTLLPLDDKHPQNARYAFMPGAYIIEAQSGASLPEQGMLSQDGYPLIVGYSAVADTSIRSERPQVYTVRTAAEVLETEGSYVKPDPFVSGDAGAINIKGNTMILDGRLKAEALDGYQGGKIGLSAANITVQSAATSQLGGYFDFNTSFDDSSHPELQNFKNGLTVSADGLQGFREVDLGDAGSTNSITITSTAGAPTVLAASIISLAAKNQITLQDSSSLEAVTDKDKESGEGVITLTTPGSLAIGSNATVHATHAVSLDANNVTAMNGLLLSDGGALTLKSSAIYFDNGTPTGNGLHLTQAMWDGFAGFQDIALISNSGNNSGIQFLESVNLTAGNSLTLDASRVASVSQSPINVTLEAPTINFKNSGTSSTSMPDTTTGAATFTASANNEGGVGAINIGDGDVLFANFKTIGLNSQNDLTLMGKGSLSTGNGDLAINAARVTTASTSRTVNDTSNNIQTTAITAPDFVIYTGGNYQNDVQSTAGLSPAGAISINGNGNYEQSPAKGGGTLEIRGTSVRIGNGGVIQADGGSIKLFATGQNPTDGVNLGNGSMILAQGTDYAPGGQVFLQSDNGGIEINPDAVIDVSAGAQGDAGLISLQAPNGPVTINGELKGMARDTVDGKGNVVPGTGGSFILYAYQIDDIDITALNNKLTLQVDDQGNAISGGFTEALDLRARTGDVTIDTGINAHHVKLTADGGNIDITGKGNITAEGADGGTVELYAMNDVNIESGGSIQAVSAASDSLDPNVLLSSEKGSIKVNGSIDVSDSQSKASGIIYLRAQRNGDDASGNDVNIFIGPGATLSGAKAVNVEAVQTYTGSSIDTSWFDEAGHYYDTNNTAIPRLASALADPSTFHLLPGIEVTNPAGAITANTALDLSGYGYDATPGVLTIRATGDLSISQNLTDSPSGNFITSAPAGRNSWGFNLVAGADLSSADYMAVNSKGTGNLSIGNNVTVYTESAPIQFASGGDTIIGVADQLPGFMTTSYMMTYNLASFSGSIRGNVGRDLRVAGAIQTATGDIDVSVGRDLDLLVGKDTNNTGAGAIRTTGQLTADAMDMEKNPIGTSSLDSTVIDPVTGQPLPGVIQADVYGNYYWRYDNGGNINLSVGRQTGKLSSMTGQWTVADSGGAWDYFSEIDVTIPSQSMHSYYGIFSADYAYGTAGLATMGGGDLTVHTGGDFLAQAGTFGSGNLAIYSGGDVKGRFLNKDGEGEIHAMGNFGAFDERTQIELFNSQMKVAAQGEIQIGAVLNPTLASDKADAYRQSSFVQCTYTDDTRIDLKAGTDATIEGNAPFYNYVVAGTDPRVYERVLPATVNIDAEGNIVLMNNFTLASSPTGNLTLQAGGDVLGLVANSGTGTYQSAQILMSDISPWNWYGLFYIGYPSDPEQSGHWLATRTTNLHGLYDPSDNTWSYPEPLHTGDGQPITITAGEDIKELNLKFPKQAEVTAGRDIVDVTYEGQNISPDDVSMIRAGRNVSMQYLKASQASTNSNEQIGLIQGGPGTFLVQAAGSIDLGSSLPDGIQEIGNGNNPAVGTGKSSLIILSGYSFGENSNAVSSDFATTEDVRKFFSAISSAGDEYARLMAEGKLDDAAALLQTTRDANITPLLNTASGAGDINMTSSQISTSNAASDIFVIANGNLNLGKTALPSANVVNTTTGITTANGGAINIFAVKDVNVQESRVMTFFSRDDIKAQVEGLGLGALTESVVDELVKAKKNGDSQAFEDYLQTTTLSADTKSKLSNIEKDVTMIGDITVWSDQGNINAGRGSRSAVSPRPPKVQIINGVTRLVFNPPAVGSGIRAMTYGDNAPDPGNIHLFAPTGVIDAGEAGIAGSSVTLAALTVTNAANISFSAGSIGVPQQAAASASIGTLSGAGGAAQNSQLTSDVAGIDLARAQATQMIEDIVAKWLDVKVVDFVQDDSSDSNNN